jgi:hypothetical protein
MNATDLRVAFDAGRLTRGQVLAEIHRLLDDRAVVHRRIADGLAAAAATMREDGPTEERLLAAQLQTAIALRSQPAADVGSLLDLILVLVVGINESG